MAINNTLVKHFAPWKNKIASPKDNEQKGPICHIGPFDLWIVSYSKAKLYNNNRRKG